MRRWIVELPDRPEKPLEWRGTSYSDLSGFPDAARRLAGYQLGRLQQGDEPDDWKPMPIVGPGTMEIRIRIGSAYRVFVVARFDEAIYVLHAFEKKSATTPKRHIDLAKRRYRDLTTERQHR